MSLLKKTHKCISWILCFLIFTSYFQNFAATTIRFRHSLRGYIEEQLQNIVNDFNKQYPGIDIVLEFGGDYTESFENTLNEEEDNRPNLLMVSEYNTQTMKEKKGMYIPLYEIIDTQTYRFIPVIKKFFLFDNKLLSLPFNCSTAILYYNKDYFDKAKITKVPKTWEDIEFLSKLLIDKKICQYGFTTSWPAAYIFEHFSVVHNIPFATNNNGFLTGNGSLLIDKKPYIDQLTTFIRWKKSNIYTYSGRISSDADKIFAEGKCAILLQGANRFALIKRRANFNIGVSTYPYWSKLTKTPYAINVGGTSIWVLSHTVKYGNLTRVQEFLKYLSSIKVQKEWHQKTGYLPITLDAYKKTKEGNYYDSHPNAYMAVKQVKRKHIGDAIGIRIKNYSDIRDNLMDIIEATFDGANVEELLKDIVRINN